MLKLALRVTLASVFVLTVSCGKKGGSSNEPAPAASPTAAPEQGKPELGDGKNETKPETPSSGTPTEGTPVSSFTLREKVTLAIIDSGVDLETKDFQSVLWTNEKEVASNALDDDSNGLVDDVHGWNFVEDNNELLGAKYRNTFSSDVFRFMEIAAKRELGTATTSENSWFASKAKDTAFVSQLNVYGNYSHGTHVAGIASKDNSHARLMPIKILATESARSFEAAVLNLGLPLGPVIFASFYQDEITRILLEKQQDQINDLKRVFTYAAKQGAGVANCSFGVGAFTLSKSLKEALPSLTSSEVLGGVNGFITAANEDVKTSIQAASGTLFVIAAGNDGVDNSVYFGMPTNIQAANTISVAATLADKQVARFSNYSGSLVDVAAPGVAIQSTVPDNRTLPMSGTSMAAPYVSNVATKVRAINPKLTAADTKKIILGTVDVKDFLKGKVATGGIVNAKRATIAAEMTLTRGVDTAIADARKSVADASQVTAQTIKTSNIQPGFIQPLSGKLE